MTTTTPVWEGEELTIEAAVYQALGAASVCWEDIARAGTFDPGKARAIGDELLKVIRRAAAPRTVDPSLVDRLTARSHDTTLHQPGDLALIAEAAAALRPAVPASCELVTVPDPPHDPQETPDAQP